MFRQYISSNCITTLQSSSHRSPKKNKNDNRRRSNAKTPIYDSSSDNDEPSEDEFSVRPRKHGGRKKSVVPFDGDSQKTADLVTLQGLCRAATHEFAPVKPAKKQFMYWGGAPDSAAVMLVDRFVKNLTRLIP
jgi:hypothetical protein